MLDLNDYSLKPSLVVDNSVYPVEALGPLLRGAVDAIQKLTDAPVPLIAQSVLFAASSAVHCLGDVVHPMSGKATPISLWFVTVARSGERKSTVDSFAMRAIREREGELIAEHKIKDKIYQREIAIYKHEMAATLKAHDSDTVTTGLIDDLESKEPKPPLSPYLIATDFTAEGLSKHLAQSHPSLSIATDEGGQFIGGYSMQSENKSHTMAALSGYWGGSSNLILRAGDSGGHVLNKRVGLHLMVQPRISGDLLNSEEAKDQGILGRLFVVHPTSSIGKRIASMSPEAVAGRVRAAEVLREYDKFILGLLRRPVISPEGSPEQVTPRSIPVVNEARDLWMDFYNIAEEGQGEASVYGDITSLASKMGEQVLRVSAVLALIENVDVAEVSAEHMRRAIILGNFYLAEAIKLSDASYIDAASGNADIVHKWIVERWPHGPVFSPVDIMQRISPRRLRVKEVLRPAMGELVKLGRIVPLDGAHTIDGKKRVECYRLGEDGL